MPKHGRDTIPPENDRKRTARIATIPPGQCCKEGEFSLGRVWSRPSDADELGRDQHAEMLRGINTTFHAETS